MTEQKTTITKESIRSMFKSDQDPWEIVLKCAGIYENPNTINKICFDSADASNIKYE